MRLLPLDAIYRSRLLFQGSAGRRAGGFSILEVLAALGIFGLISSTVYSSLISHLNINMNNEIRSQAILAAQQQLDGLRGTQISAIPTTGYQDKVIEVGARRFAVRTYFCDRAEYCSSESMRHITCAVSFNDSLRFRTETIFTSLR